MSVKLLYTRGWAYQDKKNGQVGQHKTTAKVAAACETSTYRGATAP
ncbi:MAG: hypothetical protein O4965_30015 [Trichodesmium sp. St19_bin1]|nr:hypothetical protein [Trichodesmium sp. St19_bin1]